MASKIVKPIAAASEKHRPAAGTQQMAASAPPTLAPLAPGVVPALVIELAAPVIDLTTDAQGPVPVGGSITARWHIQNYLGHDGLKRGILFLLFGTDQEMATNDFGMVLVEGERGSKTFIGDDFHGRACAFRLNYAGATATIHFEVEQPPPVVVAPHQSARLWLADPPDWGPFGEFGPGPAQGKLPFGKPFALTWQVYDYQAGSQIMLTVDRDPGDGTGGADQDVTQARVPDGVTRTTITPRNSGFFNYRLVVAPQFAAITTEPVRVFVDLPLPTFPVFQASLQGSAPLGTTVNFNWRIENYLGLDGNKRATAFLFFGFPAAMASGDSASIELPEGESGSYTFQSGSQFGAGVLQFKIFYARAESALLEIDFQGGPPEVHDFIGAPKHLVGEQHAGSLEVLQGSEIALSWKIFNADLGELTDPSGRKTTVSAGEQSATVIAVASGGYTLVAVRVHERSKDKKVYVTTHRDERMARFSDIAVVFPPSKVGE